jgi:hypothetical protein
LAFARIWSAVSVHTNGCPAVDERADPGVDIAHGFEHAPAGGLTLGNIEPDLDDR